VIDNLVQKAMAFIAVLHYCEAGGWFQWCNIFCNLCLLLLL